MVLMNKKDGTVTSAAEAYPLPRIDDIIDQIGRAQYLTTIDLTKGYWQVPVASEDHHKLPSARHLGSLNLMLCHLTSRERQGHFKG